MTTPEISYVGSVDTSSSPSGSLLISVSFPSSIKALMFEYKYQLVETDIADLTNSFYGFVYPDSVAPAQNNVDGFSEYVLPLPLLDNSVTSEYNVAVRVYLMESNTSYTAWSNSLLVIKPPDQPVIVAVLFDEGDYYASSRSRLWVQLNKDYIDARPGVKYIVSYYYVKQNTTSTSWATTGLLDLDVRDINKPYLSFLMDGNISTSYQVAYVAVNAVLPFEDEDENQFYSVSEISNTVDATPLEIVAPVLNDLVYTENANGSQNIVASWSAPTNSFIPNFTVGNYVLECRIYPTNGTPPVVWTEVNNNIPPTQLTYTYNIDTASNPEGYSFDFRVRADLQSGTDTDYSNVESVTQASIIAPEQNDIVYSVYTNGNQNMNLSWDAPKNNVSLGLTMTPSEYRVYTSINSGNYTFITTDGNQTSSRTYVYTIPTEYYNSVVTNIAFKIEPVFRPTTGAFVTAVSDVEDLNTFTYATAPQSLSINWAVPDIQVPTGVDVSFVFRNVLDAGLGNVARPTSSIYLCKIVNSINQAVVAQSNVTYVSSQVTPYIKQMTFVPTQGTSPDDYVVDVSLQTADTNYLHALLEGAHVTSSAILVASVPVIYDVQVTSLGINIYNPKYSVEFKIASNTILAPQAALFYAQTAGDPEIPILYQTTSVTPVRELDNWIYTFSGNDAIIINNNYEGFVLTAGNEAGIGFNVELN